MLSAKSHFTKVKFLFFITLFIKQSLALSPTTKSPRQQLRTIEQTYLNLNLNDYYSTLYKDNGDYYDQLSLKIELRNIISKKHCFNWEQNKSRFINDKEGCSANEYPFQFKSYNYKTARKILFGDIDLNRNKLGQLQISGFYCEEIFRNDIQFNQNTMFISPYGIPDQKILNAEHLWPQSKFKYDKDKFVKKTDLHHLRPAESLVNNKRASRAFSLLESSSQVCLRGSELAKKTTKRRGDFFQPSPKIRGDIARSLFYFSLMYDKDLSVVGDVNVLLQWHKDDPVTLDEIMRNEKIFEYQQNRNPFIDRPELAELIFN